MHTRKTVTPFKMITPLVYSWVKESKSLARFGINSAEMRTFRIIARKACQRVIIQFVLSSPCAWNDMLDVKRVCANILRRLTIFTTPPGALLDLGTHRLSVHTSHWLGYRLALH